MSGVSFFNSIYERVGRRIKDLRVKNGFTQEELALKLDVSRMTMANLEAGRQRPSLVQILILMKTLNVSSHELLPLDDTMKEYNLSDKPGTIRFLNKLEEKHTV